MMTDRIVEANRPLEPQRKVIIVGASSGIGAALVHELAGRGYRLAAVARREALLAELCQSVGTAADGGARAVYYTHNVADFNEIPALFQRITHDLHGLDLIIYAAGVQPVVSPDEYDFEKDAAMTRVNLLGAMAWLGQAAHRFVQAGAGQIVGISSIAAERGRRPNPAYNASKAGLDTYLEALRNRLSRNGVTVTTVRPGFVDTALLENTPRVFWVVSPEEAASQIARAITRGKQTIYVPGRWRYVGLVIRHIPSVIFRRMSF